MKVQLDKWYFDCQTPEEFGYYYVSRLRIGSLRLLSNEVHHRRPTGTVRRFRLGSEQASGMRTLRGAGAWVQAIRGGTNLRIESSLGTVQGSWCCRTALLSRCHNTALLGNRRMDVWQPDASCRTVFPWGNHPRSSIAARHLPGIHRGSSEWFSYRLLCDPAVSPQLRVLPALHIGMGVSPGEFIGARFSFFLTVVVVLALFITVVVDMTAELRNPAMFLGFILVGSIYGAYGGLVGLVSKDFMVAVLCVVLLANLDAGWLQNPVFYSTAQESTLIRWLPAFNPTQVVFAAAFTGRMNLWAAALSLVYAALFVAAMLAIVHTRVRSLRRWWK